MLAARHDDDDDECHYSQVNSDSEWLGFVDLFENY